MCTPASIVAQVRHVTVTSKTAAYICTRLQLDIHSPVTLKYTQEFLLVTTLHSYTALTNRHISYPVQSLVPLTHGIISVALRIDKAEIGYGARSRQR